jgi:hypothetical protein
VSELPQESLDKDRDHAAEFEAALDWAKSANIGGSCSRWRGKIAKFRKKPVIIDAEQFFPDNQPLPFAAGHVCCLGPNGWYINTLEGVMCLSRGDWVIRGVKGEFYCCKPDIFEATYEPLAR